ncbi:MAG: GNAT family N-acetyltransferase, partial [Nanoarchaeota archaeon]
EVFLAVVAGAPAGLVAVNSCQSIHADSRHGRIMTIVVRRTMKRQGVGRALMRHALIHLRRLGCRKIELTSRVYRGGAHRFYRAMGFKATSVRFSRTLRG